MARRKKYTPEERQAVLERVFAALADDETLEMRHDESSRGRTVDDIFRSFGVQPPPGVYSIEEWRPFLIRMFSIAQDPFAHPTDRAGAEAILADMVDEDWTPSSH
jgi:hypothetical protein